ncbi:AAA family ATPase [Vibrio navarrensis]|uniref:AAA family ATPase n=1 Tax=Vibrio navarrensis TaxID=29495 RepID=UPI001869C02F|nr:AAA family ATPase [Vibrio navarrensis]MBE4619557.1 general secretion pathway protein GspA [Vibrio navarrensis]
MYKDFFGFSELPFSIVPNSRYLYLSQRHREAITHLQAGLGDGGGFAMLTGEVGTGKTTVAKSMLANLGDNKCAALLLNPTFSSLELLEAICDEFNLSYPQQASLKQLHQIIHQFLLRNHQMGRQTLLVIDEAQHLAADVLEQLRLLTNLETESSKLLKVLLVGQPELQKLLQTTQLRQLAQRITGRYHLLPLDERETADYIAFRLHTAGGDKQLFDRSSTKLIAKYSHGIPRLINLICDKALQLSFYQSTLLVSKTNVHKACEEVMQFQAQIYQQPQTGRSTTRWAKSAVALSIIALLASGGYWYTTQLSTNQAAVASDVEPDAPSSALVIAPAPSENIVDLLMARQDPQQALSELYQVWGYQASEQDSLCLNAPLSVFRCARLQSNWQEIVQANRPVVLTLQQQNQRGYVVLWRVQHEWVEVLSGDARLRVPVSELLALWRGETMAIWRAPLRDTLKLNMSGEAITLLDQLLAKALNDDPLGSEHFDSALQRRVEWFQQWQGINVDGIAGPNTLSRLQQLVQLSAPSLQQGAELDEQEKLAQRLSYPPFGYLSPLPRTFPQASLVEAKPAPILLAQNASSPEQPNADKVQDLLDNLDLSGFSPELAMKVESALASPSPEPSQSKQGEVHSLEMEAARWRGRLPALNLQSHIYSNDSQRRWLKINGAEYRQGDWIEQQVKLVEILPQSIVVEFDGEKIAIPALYEWKG